MNLELDFIIHIILSQDPTSEYRVQIRSII